MTARAPVRDAPTLWALAVRQSMGAEADVSASTPQPGGAHINGRLAPESFKVPHMKAYSPPPEG